MTAAAGTRERLLSKFRAVALERLQRVGRALLAFERGEADEAAWDETLRLLHTIKGEAKMLGLATTNAVTHRLESALLAARARGGGWTHAQAEASLADLDALTSLIGHLDPTTGKEGATAAATAPTSGLATGASLPAAGASLPAAGASLPAAGTGQSAAGTGLPAAGASLPAAGASLPAAACDARLAPATAPAAALSPPQASDAVPARAAAATEFTRVDMQSLNALMEIADALVVCHGGWSEIARGLQELARPHAPTSRPDESCGELGAAAELRRLGARAAEQAYDAGVFIEQLCERLRALRLVPVSNLLWRYERAVRDLATEQGKRITVRIEDHGAQAEKHVLDALEEPLLHLVRNAVDHGIEAAAERQAARKPAAGTITLVAEQLGGHVRITVSDDGRGLVPETLRAAACARGFLTKEQSERVSEAELWRLIFRPGFTSARVVSDISGRGVGLDVVSRCIEGLAGQVDLRSAPGAGTTFSLVVPVSLVVAAVVAVVCQDTVYGFPAAAVRVIVDGRGGELVDAGREAVLRVGDAAVPIVALESLLGLPAPREAAGRLIVLTHEHRSLAVRVERVLGELRILQRAADPLIKGLSLVSGTAQMPDGRLMLLFSVPALLRAATSGNRHDTRTEPSAKEPRHG